MPAPSLVAMLPCEHYDRGSLKKIIDRQLQCVLPAGLRGQTVLLKPNLVSGRGHEGLACTDAVFVAAAAELFLDHGARVLVGDSPAFGSAGDVMRRCGMASALEKMAVKHVDFTAGPTIRLAHGLTVRLAGEVFECDLLLNMPRVKAHCQMRVSLAVKNLFGTVVGWRKPLLHITCGDSHGTFVKLLVDLIDHFPTALHLVDGVIAMHCTGPVAGSPFSLGIVGLSDNAVAMDTALLSILDIAAETSPVWLECRRRNLPGISLQHIRFPLQDAARLKRSGFLVPDRLSPIRFSPLHTLGSLRRRLFRP